MRVKNNTHYVLITVDEAMAHQINEFRFANRIKSEAATVRALMTLGFEALADKEKNAAALMAA
jgi:hypothetical protein